MSPQVDLISKRPGEFCAACRYSLRGIDSERCPECGAPICLRVDCPTSHEFDFVRGAFEAEGIRYDCKDPSDGVGGAMQIIAGLNSSGFFFVHPDDTERAVDLLDDIGFGGTRPLVDRSEPVCPHCDASLEVSNDNEICPSCQGAFRWVDVDEAYLEDDADQPL